MAGTARAGDRDDLDGDEAVVARPRGTGTDSASHDGAPADPNGRDGSPRDSSTRAAPHEAQRTPGGPTDAPALGENPKVEESALPPHEPGSMDISVHEETYQRFIGLVIRAVITIFVVLVLLALING